MTQPSLSQINIYPVKSLGGFAVASADVESRGLQHDRRWMLVDEEGCFLTQRELPRMALVSTTVEADCLTLRAPGTLPLQVTLEPVGGTAQTVRVWRSVCEARPVGVDADRWLTEFLGVACRLVFMPGETRRTVNPDHSAGEGIVSFADGYPLMLLGEASLHDLNMRLGTAGADEPLPAQPGRLWDARLCGRRLAEGPHRRRHISRRQAL